MRKRFMERGAEMGLWSAEDFQSESNAGEEVSVPKRELSFPMISSLRDDNLTLGAICLGVTAGAAGIFTKEALLDNRAKTILRYMAVGLGFFGIGRITRQGDLKMMVETFAQERNMMEQVLNKMEHDIEEKEEVAAESARKQILDVGGGMLDAFHMTMGSSLTQSSPSFTTRAHGQNPFSQLRY